jgi:hypothetical protein
MNTAENNASKFTEAYLDKLCRYVRHLEWRHPTWRPAANDDWDDDDERYLTHEEVLADIAIYAECWAAAERQLGEVIVLHERADFEERMRSKAITFALGSLVLQGTKEVDKKDWQSFGGSVLALIEGHLSEHKVDRKDGKAITQGELIGIERKSVAVRANSIMMIDVDTGASIIDVLKDVYREGLFCILWTVRRQGFRDS